MKTTYTYEFIPLSKTPVYLSPGSLRVIEHPAERHIGYLRSRTFLDQLVWQPYLLDGDPLLGVTATRGEAAKRLKDFYDYRGRKA